MFEARDMRLLSAADRQDAVTLACAFRVEGLPTDEVGARAMFEADHKKFEMWAVGPVPAISQEENGADGGVDNLAYFDAGNKDLTETVVQVSYWEASTSISPSPLAPTSPFKSAAQVAAAAGQAGLEL